MAKLRDICAYMIYMGGQSGVGKITYRYLNMSVGGVMYEEVVIDDDDVLSMMLQFLTDNRMQLAEVYVETEKVGETHSHEYFMMMGLQEGTNEVVVQATTERVVLQE
ncbi:unnamed protein product [Linum trigynum]|uniref:Uncharacterized protein n=1 Tax=Linum trigynum TaxID=586398 RepID=A0AAV2EUS4_9ROSI